MKPVTIKSNPKEILHAFKASPYWRHVTKAQQKQAATNPVAWLESHPDLFTWYPSFFRDIEGINIVVFVRLKIKAPARKRKAKRR